jgi:ferrous iron transport protein A
MKSPEDSLLNAITLAKARQGMQYEVVRIDGGGNVRTRLASLGVLPGQNITVMQPGGFGPVMIAVKGSKLALGGGVTKKVLVRPIDLSGPIAES